MSHINYFKPFKSKPKWHEDQLTRAFLVVLRYSPSAILMFYDQIFNSIIRSANKRKIDVEMPSISQLDFTNVKFETQITNINDIISNQVASVLITDELFETQYEINNSERGARYDGIITFSSDITLIIENKPKSYNVWEEQLSPNLTGISTSIIKTPAIIEWKEIIKTLNSILKNESISGAEKLIINDFLDYIDREFPYLNPYDNLSLCKNEESLIRRRIKNILLSIACKEEYVETQRGWGDYIKTNLKEIQMVGLIYKKMDENDWKIDLCLYFGDTQNQSRHFYEKGIGFDIISELKKNGWSYVPNFHLSHMQKGIIWFDTPKESQREYFEYWHKNLSKIKQYPKSELKKYLNELVKLKLIEINKDGETELEKKIINTKRDKINVCPGSGLIYSFSSQKAIELDMRNGFTNEIKKLIVDGLGILNKKIDFLK